MADINYHYYLLHQSSKTMIEKLTWSQFHGFCRIISEKELGSFQVWIAELNQWLPLKKLYPEVMKRADGLFRSPPTPPNDNEFDHQLIEKDSEKRSHPRLAVRIPVTIDLKGSIINSFTEDISVGGFKFENVIPNKSCIDTGFVFFVYKDELVEFKVRLLFEGEDKSHFSRVDFVSCNNLSLWKKIIASVKL